MLRQALPSCAICSWDYRLLYSVSFIWGYPLNALVQTRDTAFDAAAYAIQADLMDQIKFQWYVEMYGEGFGYENHIRWDDPIDLTNSGADPVYYGKGFSVAAPSGNNDWIWKIPQKEIDANPNLTEADQN